MAVTLDGTAGITSPAIILDTSVLSSAVTGEFEYDGKVPYFTPQGLERGVVPGMQYYRLNSGLLGANAPGAQSTFGVGVTLSSSTVYYFESYAVISKTAGTTPHTISFGYGGTATVNNALVYNVYFGSSSGFPIVLTAGTSPVIQTNNSTAIIAGTGSISSTAFADTANIRGTVSINTGGTFIPQYQLSAAPGGAYTTQTGSYFLIYPIGAAGSNTSVGTWS